MATGSDQKDTPKADTGARGTKDSDAQDSRETKDTRPPSPDAGKPGEPAEGIAQALADAHERRVTVPGAPNVDARLDNRTGAQRPPIEDWPAKPQQVDGPDVMGQVEHTRRTLNQDALGKDVGDVGDRKGMFSPGPHGLSGEEARQGASEEDEAISGPKGKPTAG